MDGKANHAGGQRMTVAGQCRGCLPGYGIVETRGVWDAQPGVRFSLSRQGSYMKKALAFIVAFACAFTILMAPKQASAAGGTKFLIVGDSISASCNNPGQAQGWCTDFDTILTSVGVKHEINGHATPGWSCSNLQQGFAARFDQVMPDIVIIACGTNDAPNSQAAKDQLGWAWRSMAEYSYTHGAKVLATLIQYSEREIQAKYSRSWLMTGEENANDTIYSNAYLYGAIPNSMILGFADLQKIPPTLDYLLGGSDGIHPTDIGHRVYAATYYRALAPAMGWPDAVKEPCGKYGHRPIYSEPAYIRCPSGITVEY